MTTNQILTGVGLILVLAVGAQVLAGKLRIPAIIVLLPAGFIAGALTTDVNPERLLGPAFEPLVSLSVAVTFLVIVATVTLYGLTAAPVARRLRVGRPDRTRPLLVGGERWVIDLGRALQSAGLEVLMWAGLDEQRQQVRQAGLELAPGELLAAATGRGARLEEITAVFLLTDEDDFNALASVLLAGSTEGRVYRLAPPLRSHGVVAPYANGEILFGDGLTRLAVSDRYHDGARIVVQRTGNELPAGHDLLFVVRADGQLAAVTHTSTPVPLAGDITVSLGPVPAACSADGQPERS